ncbi:MAG: SMC-Scp complex subunit ScpB [Fusobacteriaceae bacterium]
MVEILSELEAIIFLSGDGVKIKEIMKHYSMDFFQTVNLLSKLKENWEERGINLEIGEETVHFITNPYCGEAVMGFFEQESKPKKLSGAALETVSIIAYRQPVTKSEIEAIRGVSTDRIIQNLEERKFIKVCGKKESPGRPNLYEITDKFLAYLSIESVEQLPKYNEIRGGNNGENKNK